MNRIGDSNGRDLTRGQGHLFVAPYLIQVLNRVGITLRSYGGCIRGAKSIRNIRVGKLGDVDEEVQGNALEAFFALRHDHDPAKETEQPMCASCSVD